MPRCSITDCIISAQKSAQKDKDRTRRLTYRSSSQYDLLAAPSVYPQLRAGLPLSPAPHTSSPRGLQNGISDENFRRGESAP